MSSDQDLNTLMAEQVLKWRRGGYENMEWVTAEGEGTGYFLSEFGSQECTPWEPATEIADAWFLVDWIIERGYPVRISFIKGTGWEIFIKMPDGKNLHLVEKSVELAICNAVLRLCGGITVHF